MTQKRQCPVPVGVSDRIPDGGSQLLGASGSGRAGRCRETCQEGVAASAVGVQCTCQRPRTLTTCFLGALLTGSGVRPRRSRCKCELLRRPRGQGPVL